jgi:hypothetical protein
MACRAMEHGGWEMGADEIEMFESRVVVWAEGCEEDRNSRD